MIDQATPFRRAHPAHLEKTKKNSDGATDSKEVRRGPLRTTNLNRRRVHFNLDGWEDDYDSFYWFRLKKMGNMRPAIKNDEEQLQGAVSARNEERGEGI